MSAKARINAQGRVVIPAECREAAGLKPGDEVLVDVVGRGELRLRSKGRAIEKVRAMYARLAPKDRDIVQELIDERRREAGRE